MDAPENPTAATDPAYEVPEGVRRARAAFLRDFAKLIAGPKTRGKFICYHEDKLVAVNADYKALLRTLNTLKLPRGSWLIFEVVPEAEREEQAFERGEMP